MRVLPAGEVRAMQGLTLLGALAVLMATLEWWRLAASLTALTVMGAFLYKWVRAKALAGEGGLD